MTFSPFNSIDERQNRHWSIGLYVTIDYLHDQDGMADMASTQTESACGRWVFEDTSISHKEAQWTHVEYNVKCHQSVEQRIF